MRGDCERCGNWSNDLRKTTYRDRDYGYICKKCRKIACPDLSFNLKIW